MIQDIKITDFVSVIFMYNNTGAREREREREREIRWFGCHTDHLQAEIEDIVRKSQLNQWGGIYIQKCTRSLLLFRLVQKAYKGAKSLNIHSIVFRTQYIHG